MATELIRINMRITQYSNKIQSLENGKSLLDSNIEEISKAFQKNVNTLPPKIQQLERKTYRQIKDLTQKSKETLQKQELENFQTLVENIDVLIKLTKTRKLFTTDIKKLILKAKREPKNISNLTKSCEKLRDQIIAIDQALKAYKRAKAQKKLKNLDNLGKKVQDEIKKLRQSFPKFAKQSKKLQEI